VEPSSPAPQEEEPVGDQVIAPSSTMTPTVQVPTWAAEPEVVPPPVSSREEAIAEVLRDALAQGHSDEALAGILRKVLDGASPQSALAAQVVEPVRAESAPEPAVQPEPQGPVAELTVAVAPEVVVPEMVGPETVLQDTTVQETFAVEPARDVETTFYEAPAFEVPDFEPVFEVAAAEAAAYDLPVHEAPVPGATMFEVPVFEPRATTPSVDPFAPVAPAPAWVLSPATSMWGPPTMSATLWGEPATPVVPRTSTYTPIWDEFSAPAARSEPVESSLFEERTEDVLFVEVTEEAHAEQLLDDADEALVELEPAVAEVQLEDTALEDVVFEDVVFEDTVLEETVLEDTVAEDAEVDDVLLEDTLIEEPVVEDAVAEELAPLLARTASDPAPSMSFDSTTIMPPLSLLPPLPGSRGRGRPPVPPAPRRPPRRGVS
jgi:hypothetical protein